MFVFMSVVVTVWGLWEVCCVAALLKIACFCLGVLKYVYVCVVDVMDVVFSVCIVRRGAVCARVWEV